MNTVRRILFFILLVMVCTFTVFTYASANVNTKQNNGTAISEYLFKRNKEGLTEERPTGNFDLPDSLVTIEESAFEGSAIVSVDLPDSIEIIGDYAFANIQSLKKISLPNSIQFVDKNAFKGSDQLTITGAPKGYANTFAKENGIPFNPIASFYAYSKTIQITVLTNNKTELQRVLLIEETTEQQTMNPTGRMAGELNASRYESYTAFYIQGRSPPIG